MSKVFNSVTMTDQLAEHRARLSEDGYTILENLLTTEESEVLLRELLEVQTRRGISSGRIGLDDDASGSSPFLGTGTVRTSNLVKEGPVFEQLALRPQILGLVEHLVGEDPLLSNFVGLNIAPGAARQPFHNDDKDFGDLPRPHQTITCNLIVALCDFTAENGATRIVPGSHLFVEDPGTVEEIVRRQEEPRYDWKPAIMKAGSMLIYDGAFIHSAGENTSDSWRPAISMQFVAGWIRPAYNFSLSVPIELARTFPRQLQQLCGFGIYKGGYIGRLEGEQSAIDLLLS